MTYATEMAADPSVDVNPVATKNENGVDDNQEEISPISIKALKIEKKALQDDLANRESTIHRLQTQVHEMKRELKIVQADVDAIVEEKEMLMEELEELRKRKNPECTQCSALEARIEEMTKEATTLQNHIDVINAEHEPLKKSLSLKDITVQEMNTRLADLERRLANDKSEYEKAVSDRDQSIDSLQKKIHEQKREVNVLTDDYDSMAEEKHEVEQELEGVRQETIKLQDNINGLESLVVDLREEIEELKRRNQQLAASHNEEKSKAIALESSLSEITIEQERTLSSLQGSLESSKSTEDVLLRVQSDWETKTTILLLENDDLKRQLDIIKQEKIDAGVRHHEIIEKLQEEQSKWEEMYKQAIHEKNEFKHQVTDYMRTIKDAWDEELDKATKRSQEDQNVTIKFGCASM